MAPRPLRPRCWSTGTLWVCLLGFLLQKVEQWIVCGYSLRKYVDPLKGLSSRRKGFCSGRATELLQDAALALVAQFRRSGHGSN